MSSGKGAVVVNAAAAKSGGPGGSLSSKVMGVGVPPAVSGAGVDRNAIPPYETLLRDYVPVRHVDREDGGLVVYSDERLIPPTEYPVLVRDGVRVGETIYVKRIGPVHRAEDPRTGSAVGSEPGAESGVPRALHRPVTRLMGPVK